MDTDKDIAWAENTNSYRDNPFNALAKAMHFSAIEAIESFGDELDKLFKKDNQRASSILAGIYTEYIALFVYLTDRELFSMVGLDNCSKVVDELRPYIIDNAQVYYEGDYSDLLQIVGSVINDAGTDYADCEYFTSKNGFIDKKAILTRLTYRIINVFHKDPKDPIVCVNMYTDCFKGAMIFRTFIKLDEWLKGPIMALGIKDYKSIDLAPPSSKK